MPGFLGRITKISDHRLKMFAGTLLIIGVFDCLLGLLLLSMNYDVIGWVLLTLSVGFLFVFLPMLLYGWVLTSKILVPYFAVTVLFVAASYYGPTVNIDLTIFIGAIYPFVVFRHKETLGILSTIPVPIIFYFALEATEYKLLNGYFGDASHVGAFSSTIGFAITVSTYCVVAATLYLFVRVAGKFQDELEVANQHLDSLIRTVCHDIRNPLMVSLGYSKMISSNPESISHKKLDAILRSNLQIEQIIANIMEIQRVKSTKLTLNLAPVNLELAIEDSLFTLKQQFEKKSIAVVCGENLKHVVKANQSALCQSVINNILSNAIKFSHKETSIFIDASKSEDNQVRLTIRDHGVGIPETLMQHIFDPSSPTTRKGTNNEAGTGFGLPIAKAYLEAMGGTISVTSKTQEESPKDHGTTFEIRLQPA